MIREYLEKIQKELIDQKRETEKKIISLENTEKENIKKINFNLLTWIFLKFNFKKIKLL